MNYDTVRFVREKFVGIGDYYSNSRITKGYFHSGLYKVSTGVHYLTARNEKKGGFASFIGLGADLADRANWQLGKDISKEEINLYFKIELYCQGVQSRSITADAVNKDLWTRTEQTDPILEWGKGVNGYIFGSTDELSAEIRLILDPGRKKDSNAWAKIGREWNNVFGTELPECGKGFAIWCNFLNEEITIVYSAVNDRIYLFNSNDLVALYHPEKWKFLVRKNKEESPFLLVKEDLEENARIRLLVLSMLSQWFMNVIHLY